MQSTSENGQTVKHRQSCKPRSRKCLTTQMALQLSSAASTGPTPAAGAPRSQRTGRSQREQQQQLELIANMCMQLSQNNRMLRSVALYKI